MRRIFQRTFVSGPWGTMSVLSLTPLIVALVLAARANEAGDTSKKTTLKAESFDKDPGWEGHNNRIVPDHRPTVTQDFGYSETNVAGKAAGEMGGVVTRASEPAFYADRVGPVTLDDPLSASGTFALTQTAPGGGIFFGVRACVVRCIGHTFQ